MTIAAPGFFDLVTGRVTLLEWSADWLRNLELPADELAHFLSRQNIDEDDVWGELEDSVIELGMELHDFQQADKSKRGARKGSRPWEQIRGDCFHQTAALIDDVERCVNIPAAVLVTPTAVGIAHPPTAYLYTQHSGNRNFTGVEVACRAAGVEGNPKTFWRTKRERKAGTTPADIWREPTDTQLAAAFLVAKYHAQLNSLHGCPHTHYGFHRNFHRSRVSDIGSKGARYLGLRMRNELGLDPVAKMGSGKLTPYRWGGEKGVSYSWKVK